MQFANYGLCGRSHPPNAMTARPRPAQVTSGNVLAALVDGCPLDQPQNGRKWKAVG